ncbi:hypothetical protein COU80_02655 [Candidatus Peregrinibacteria bacterium CG10_big_fil_rev_8_21_14_0_10_55_24]|nr:MAG: hypothetical protein COU80_02655 [Candidatus Peregrinibacteria bacterium CG10_big_fil_rev_8_21_14_0_10_55_24]
MESYRLRQCELCYECIDCVDCYNCAFTQDSENCSESTFLKNCIGCKHCLMCSNLRNKEYYVENKPVTKEQFAQFRSLLSSYSRLQNARERFDKLKIEYPQKFMHGTQNENVIGDYLTNCKNVEQCFDCSDLWDCKYAYQAFDPLKDVMDIQECGEAERLYEDAFVGYNAHNVLFTTHTLGQISDIYYSSHSPYNKNLFGCIGLRHKEFCVLNKQYSKDDYEILVARIIEHMQKTNEWGEFFPIDFSLFPYNETMAQDYFPLTQEEAQKQGLWWAEKEESIYKGQIVKEGLPDDVRDFPETLCEKILQCKKTGRSYKIIPQELILYRQLNLPLPRLCFQERHRNRMLLRNARVFYDRTCDKCGVKFKTTYAPDRPEKIYCESCYQTSFA